MFIDLCEWFWSIGNIISVYENRQGLSKLMEHHLIIAYLLLILWKTNNIESNQLKIFFKEEQFYSYMPIFQQRRNIYL